MYRLVSRSQTNANATHSIQEILNSQKSVKDIKVSIRAEFFGMDWAASQSTRRFKGIISSWKKKEDFSLMIKWDGWARNKANTLDTLLGEDENGDSFAFKIESHDDGSDVVFIEPAPDPARAAGRRGRGAAAAADAAVDDDDEDEEDDEETNKDAPASVDKDGQVWKLRTPEAIKTDARKQLRFDASLKSPAVDKKSITETLEHFMPTEWIDGQLKHTNALLHGSGANAPMSKGELLQWWGYGIALSLNPGIPLEKMWSNKVDPDNPTILPPACMGRHGMTFKRWKTIRSNLRFGPSDAASLDADPWAFVRPLVDTFNERMAAAFSPGWLLCVDESMCAWRGKQGRGDPARIPFLSWVPRKPEPLGVEMKTAACALSGVLTHVEICEGKEAHPTQKFFDKTTQPHTTATTMRLVEEWFGTNRVVYGDSWFAGVKTARALLSNGLHFIGDVKTNHSRFPKDALEMATSEERGAWAVYSSELTLDDGSKEPVFGVSHRRGPAVHEYIATCGTTLKGKAHTGTIEDQEDEHQTIEFELERKCPKVLNDTTLGQPAIDRHNRYRQFILAMEKRLLTDKFCVRFGTTMHAMLFTNAFFSVRKFGNPLADFKSEMNKLALYLMHNPTRRLEMAGPQRTPTSANSSRTTTPIIDDGREHVLIPLKKLEGYKGGKQQKCNICNVLCSWVCITCTEHPMHPFPCHPHVTNFRGKITHHQCLGKHTAAPHAVTRGTRKAKRARASPQAEEAAEDLCQSVDEDEE